MTPLQPEDSSRTRPFPTRDHLPPIARRVNEAARGAASPQPQPSQSFGLPPIAPRAVSPQPRSMLLSGASLPPVHVTAPTPPPEVQVKMMSDFKGNDLSTARLTAVSIRPSERNPVQQEDDLV